MHSPSAESRRAIARATLLAALVWGGVDGVHAQDVAPAASQAASATIADAASAPTAASAPDADAASAPKADARADRIEAAVHQLRVDPLLSGHHKEHTLRWKDSDEPEKKKEKAADSSMFEWLVALARFLNDTSRFLLWGVVLVLVALLLVSARHLVQLRGFRRNAARASAVSHVRDLDVRPESLPDDVGAAAWALWQAGQVQAALSLLYRGALSRLIHRFRVPITSSATEGECLDLARGRLDPVALRYVTQVVRAWEASIYGGRSLSTAMGEALCSGFAQRLDASPAAAVEEAA